VFDNDALFVASTAYFVQSKDGRLAILCFRGSEPKNVISWLTDASVKVDPFRSMGSVHGGFYRGIRALWVQVTPQLVDAQKGLSACRGFFKEDQPPESCARPISRSAVPEAPRLSNQLEALYITGHSLGGALAVLATALIYTSNELTGLENLLRGVYTFGQPMVGDGVFAKHCAKMFGEKLFRHVYDKDVVPRLPPRTAGHFEHFGHEYTSTPQGWTSRPRPVRQALTIGFTTAIGILAWVKDQLPILRWMPLPFSWGDHSPLYYLRTSQAAPPGIEFA
jgi:hypothetical protein